MKLSSTANKILKDATIKEIKIIRVDGKAGTVHADLGEGVLLELKRADDALLASANVGDVLLFDDDGVLTGVNAGNSSLNTTVAATKADKSPATRSERPFSL